VLANDVIFGTGTLMAIANSQPAHGMLILNSDGSFIYIADPMFVGVDTFTYYCNDGTNDSNIATVMIVVSRV
jgi:hypothetical protein